MHPLRACSALTQQQLNLRGIAIKRHRVILLHTKINAVAMPNPQAWGKMTDALLKSIQTLETLCMKITIRGRYFISQSAITTISIERRDHGQKKSYYVRVPNSNTGANTDSHSE